MTVNDSEMCVIRKDEKKRMDRIVSGPEMLEPGNKWVLKFDL